MRATAFVVGLLCAWVLWGAERNWEATQPARVWWVASAYPTRQECESRRGILLRDVRDRSRISYECLPETLDPRAPKR